MSKQHEALTFAGQWANDGYQNQPVLYSDQDWFCHLERNISSFRLNLPHWNENVDYAPIVDCLEECEKLEKQRHRVEDLRSYFPEISKALHDGYHDPVHMVRLFQENFQKLGKADHRKSISILIRDALRVRGVKMLQIRYELHRWYKEWTQAHGPVPVWLQKDFAFLLIESSWYEDKLAAVLFMQEILICKEEISITDMPRFEAMFRGDHIRVCKVCDHFAGKVMGHLAAQSELQGRQFEKMMDVLFAWTHADNLWQLRAAMQVLMKYAKKLCLHERLMKSVKLVVARPEKEAKSIAGAVLRSISDMDPAVVMEFLNSPPNIENMSVIALQKATNKLTNEQKQHFRNLRRYVIASRK